ncbi:hypothetical protein SAMN04487844_12262 [Methylobacterium sp. yr596]|nr:hypothetical protein SAMN04487844_12262 [Methylobacterium sp. yr596]
MISEAGVAAIGRLQNGTATAPSAAAGFRRRRGGDAPPPYAARPSVSRASASTTAAIPEPSLLPAAA